jgi:hypothetical protein
MQLSDSDRPNQMACKLLLSLENEAPGLSMVALTQARYSVTTKPRSVLMRSTELTLPELALIAATRGMLGAGVGLLVADKLTPETRRAVGRTLFLIGLVSSLPLAMLVFGRRP